MIRLILLPDQNKPDHSKVIMGFCAFLHAQLNIPFLVEVGIV